MYRVVVGTACAIIVGTAATSESRAAFTLDFEEFNLSGAPSLDVPETLNYPNAGGSGIQVTIQGGTDLRVYNMIGFAGSDPGGNGQALLDWNGPPNTVGTRFSFSSAITSFSLEAGDFGSDDDSPLKIEAYSSTDVLLDSDTTSWPDTQNPPFATLSVSAPDIAYVIYTSGGGFPGSTFIDNVTFVPSPPGVVALAGAGLLASRRRR